MGAPTLAPVDPIRTSDVSYVSEEPVDYVTPDQMSDIEHALCHYLEILSQPEGD